MSTTEISRKHHRVRELVASASRLVGKEEVASIHIALPERPNYKDLRYYREIAESRGVALTVTNTALILRLKPVYPADAEQESLVHPASWTSHEHLVDVTPRGSVNRIALSMRMVHSQISSWSAGFQGIREGTR